MSESATGQDRKSAASLVAKACGLTAQQAGSAIEIVDARKPGWKLEATGPKGKAHLIRYGKDNYTVIAK